MRDNRLRQLLDSGAPSIGTHVQISSPTMVEVIGQAGVVDYVEFVAEYAPYDLYALDNFSRAVELFDHLSAMIKVDQESRAFVAQRAIGSGMQSVLFADVRSVEDAKDCVSAVRADTPQAGGRYGATDRRFAGFDAQMRDYVQALDDVVVAIMIEKESAIKELEAILSVSGIDMVQFGPSDYSMSIGKLDRDAYRAQGVLEIEEEVIKTALKLGIHPRAEINTPRDAERYLEMGVRHFSIGTDLHILLDWWRGNAGVLREMIKGS